VEIAGDRVDLGHASEEERAKLLDAFLARHA
jgi:hypothetical protein